MNSGRESYPAPLVAPVLLIWLQTGDKSWMRKGPGSAYHKWNIFVVICDIDIPFTCWVVSFLTTTASCFNNSSCACYCSTKAWTNWLLTISGISIFANWKYLTSTFNPLSSSVQISIQSEHTANIRIIH